MRGHAAEGPGTPGPGVPHLHTCAPSYCCKGAFEDPTKVPNQQTLKQGEQVPGGLTKPHGLSQQSFRWLVTEQHATSDAHSPSGKELRGF